MSETILLGRGRRLVRLARREWEQHLAEVPQHQAARLAFMSNAHHRVRNWLVRELPRRSAPVSPQSIAQALALPPAQVATILADLGPHPLFLGRNTQGAVSWVFAVEVAPTQHALHVDSDVRRYAA